MKWRPIKTAPKDRLIILSCNEHPEYPPYVCVGRWIDIPHTNQVWRAIEEGKDPNKIEVYKCWHDGYPGIMQGSKVGLTWEYRGGILFHPTHWKDLPKPPKKEVDKYKKR